MLDKFEALTRARNLLTAIADGRGAARCALIAELDSMIRALQEGLKSEDEAHRKEKADLIDQINALTRPAEPEEGGEIIGGETYIFDLRGGAENG